ncbi:uncharacterized protein BYT42DRAFT_611955 [Radiomyces spectabilis]|uniref:uncharacterized protein n=1 Tax=Radiomyces spectabilis TaxID=64574 RepID=UPI00221F5FA6|nr:uncharacterized protein BYT42DRAFT_611955 [Radiomyces spectabilis]KAI8384236.1 hypothetical protein BYT42DRAFT_611955 [Radiomyces spectabilis]
MNSMYHIVFLTRRGAALLLQSFNLVLATFGKEVQLPVTPATARKHVGIDDLTEHIVAPTSSLATNLRRSNGEFSHPSSNTSVDSGDLMTSIYPPIGRPTSFQAYWGPNLPIRGSTRLGI